MSPFHLRLGRGIALGVAMIVLASVPASAQVGGRSTQERLREADARLDGRLDAQTRRAVVAVIDSSLGAGLLPELTGRLVGRALQFSVSGAPSGRIIGEVRDLASHLIAARRLLGNATIVEIDAAGEALSAGASPGTLSELRSARPRASLAVPLVVLVDLVQRGVPADTAADLILALAERQATDTVYHSLRLAVASDIGAGTIPVVAAATRTRGFLGAGAGFAPGTAAEADATRGLTNATTPRTRPPAPPPPP